MAKNPNKKIVLVVALLLIVIALAIFVIYFIVFPIIDKTSCENELNRTKEDYKICNSQLTSYIQSEKGLNEKIGNLVIDNSKLNSNLSDCETDRISLENKTRECEYSINNYNNTYIIKSLVLTFILFLTLSASLVKIELNIKLDGNWSKFLTAVFILFFVLILFFWK